MQAITYSRQSFGSETDSVSISVQQEACRMWATAHGITVVGEYQDANCSSEHYPKCAEGIEASRIDRGYQRWLKAQRTQGRKQYKEGLGQAFERIKQGGVTHLLIYTRNRLGRTADGSYLDRFLTNFLLEHKVSLVTVQDGTTLDFSDDFMALVMSIKDTLDYRGLREKAKASLDSIDRRINSYQKWSNAFGVVMVNGQVTFEPSKAEAIKYMYEKVIAGASYSSILKVLNATYRTFVRKQWYQTNLTNILKNPVYCGYMLNREGVMDRAKNIPNPVISYSLWQEAQKVMEGKKLNAGKYHTSDRERAHWLPLSGYLRCDCGRRMLVRMDDGKIVYQCGSPDHTRRIYISEVELATIQKVFIIGLLDDARRLATLAKASERVDGLKAKIERLQASLRAKMALVETDDDAVLYKPILDGIKAEMTTAKKDLLEAQSVESADTTAMQNRLESDFSAIMEGKLLEEETYQRLLQATISYIEVKNECITVVCKCGVSFSLPRIEGKHHAKRLMQCELLCDSDDDSIQSIKHYQLHWYDGDVQILGGECVYEDENLSVWIH